MAILPRTLLTQPAAAAVAAVTLFGFTIVGLAAHETLQRNSMVERYASPCVDVAAQLGESDFWGEREYVQYARCFDRANDDSGALEVASEGLTRHPTSEALTNLKGYHEIALGEYDAAVTTLERGLQTMLPTNGVMENNLAWAYLYVGQGGTDHARSLYQVSLQRDPAICETIHTGMFVEFESARTTRGIARAEALRNFQSLRNQYQGCENRDLGWETTVEAVGASVLYEEVELMMGTEWDQRAESLTMKFVSANLRSNFPTASVAVLCTEAMPIAELRAECVNDVQDGLRAKW